MPKFLGHEAPNATQEQTGGCCRGSALKRLALLESSCQRRSEDFVPPAAQRNAVRRMSPLERADEDVIGEAPRRRPTRSCVSSGQTRWRQYSGSRLWCATATITTESAFSL